MYHLRGCLPAVRGMPHTFRCSPVPAGSLTTLSCSRATKRRMDGDVVCEVAWRDKSLNWRTTMTLIQRFFFPFMTISMVA